MKSFTLYMPKFSYYILQQKINYLKTYFDEIDQEIEYNYFRNEYILKEYMLILYQETCENNFL